jgi:hypothetical protein
MDRLTGPKCQVSLRIAILAYHSLGDGLRDALSSEQADVGDAVTVPIAYFPS